MRTWCGVGMPKYQKAIPQIPNKRRVCQALKSARSHASVSTEMCIVMATEMCFIVDRTDGCSTTAW